MLRVLIVDDEPLISDSLLIYLQDEGMHVAGVNSGEAALALVRAGEVFDACVMDIRLPGMDGNTTIRALFALRPAMRFMIHTGSVDYVIPDDLQGIGIGDSALFRKPLMDMARLARAIQNSCS